MLQFLHMYMTTRKIIALTIWTFVGKVMPLLFNMPSSFVIVFLPRIKHLGSACFQVLLILWLQSLSTVALEPKKVKSVIVFTFPPSICHEVVGLDDMIFVFWMLSFKPAFSPSFSSRGSLVPPHFLPLEQYHLHIRGYQYFSQQSGLQLVTGCELVSELGIIFQIWVYQGWCLWEHILPCSKHLRFVVIPRCGHRVSSQSTEALRIYVNINYC